MIFDDVLTIKNGKNQKAVENPKGKYPIYGSGGVMGYADDYICSANTVVIGRKGSINNPIFVECPFWNVDTAFGLEAKAEVLIPRYLYYFCKHFNFEKLNKTVTIPSLTKSDLLRIEIDLPEIPKQQSIVSQLSKIEDVVALRQRQLQKLDELVKARFVELFGDCKNESLIGDVVSISRGASPRPISAFITDSEDGVNWIKIGDVSENSLYITKTAERITPDGAKKSRMVHKGDFILSNSMSFGRPYILGINGCVHDGWLIMSDFKESFNELYLYYALRSDDVQYQFSGKVNGATVKNLNSDLVKNTYIKVPPMEIQKQFASFVEQTDKSKVVVQKALDEAQTLFDSLMQEYFR